MALSKPRRRPVRPRPPASEQRRITRELRALAHPIRLRLLEYFAGSPRTTMQVAALMGEPPTRLYHHVNALERAGILRLQSTKQVRGTTEKYYEVAKKAIGVARPSATDAGSRAALRGLAAMVFDAARQELLAAVANTEKFTGETPPIAFRMLVSVPAGYQAKIRKRLLGAVKEIQQELKDCKDPGAESWALTVGFAPTLKNPSK